MLPKQSSKENPAPEEDAEEGKGNGGGGLVHTC